MNKENSRKYSKVAKLVGILSGFILVLGTSYAVFRVTTTGEKENVVSAGKLDVRIENEQNEINLGNTLPQTEEEGKQNTPYTFDIVNKGTINAMYDLYIEVNNDSTLDASLVRYYLTVVEDGEEKQVTPTGSIITSEEESTKEGKKAYKIDTKYLDVNKANSYNLYLWLDYDTEAEEAINKTFKANIRVDAEQIYKENKLVKQVDVSENNDGSVIAYMYGKDTVVIKGKGKIKSGLSDSLKFVSEASFLKYKEALKSMGVDVKNITTMEELYEYVDSQGSDFNDQLNDQITYICAKEVLQKMNKDSSAVVDIESLLTYLQELGWMDEEGNQTDTGEEFFTKFEDSYNKNYSLEGYSPSKIIIEDGITNIPSGLFQGNEKVEEVKIPNSVTSIGYGAFSNCSNLTSITIPNSVTSIGNYAFYCCSNLTSITIPNSVTSINSYTFNGCSKLTNIKLEYGVVNINNSAFYGCTALTSISLPNSITSIADSAFCFCGSLVSITIPESVVTVSSNVFKNCNNLQSIKIGSKLTSLDFIKECTTLQEVLVDENNSKYTSIDGVLYNKTVSDIVYVPVGKTKLVIPSGVTSIDSSDLSGCENLLSITLGKDIGGITGTSGTSIENCPSLQEILVDENNSNLTSIDGVLYNKDVTAIVRCPQGKESVTIEKTVESIWPGAFKNCKKLTEIEIPSTITSMYANVFSGCTNISSITIPHGMVVGDPSVFDGWTSSQTVNIDDTKAYVDAKWHYGWKNGCNANINYLRT